MTARMTKSQVAAMVRSDVAALIAKSYRAELTVVLS